MTHLLTFHVISSTAEILVATERRIFSPRSLAFVRDDNRCGYYDTSLLFGGEPRSRGHRPDVEAYSFLQGEPRDRFLIRLSTRLSIIRRSEAILFEPAISTPVYGDYSFPIPTIGAAIIEVNAFDNAPIARKIDNMAL